MIISGTDRGGWSRAERLTKTHQCEQCRTATLVLRYEHPDYRLLCGKCGGETIFKPKSLTRMWFDDPASVGPAVQIIMENMHFREIDAIVEGLPEPAKQAVLKKYGIEEKIRRTPCPSKD